MFWVTFHENVKLIQHMTRLIHIFSLLRQTDSLRLESTSMPCKIMSEMEWLGRLKGWPRVKLMGFYCGAVTIEPFLK